MKASELIQYLQSMVDEHGDFEMYKESWNHYDALYEGLYPYRLYMMFYDKEKLKEKEAKNTEDLCDKYRHPDRDIYKDMKEGEVVAVVL